MYVQTESLKHAKHVHFLKSGSHIIYIVDRSTRTFIWIWTQKFHLAIIYILNIFIFKNYDKNGVIIKVDRSTRTFIWTQKFHLLGNNIYSEYIYFKLWLFIFMNNQCTGWFWTKILRIHSISLCNVCTATIGNILTTIWPS